MPLAEASAITTGTPWGAYALGAQVLGGIISNDSNSSINRRNLNFQYQQAQQGIRWRMNDMREAGLNPIMAAGVSPPSGSASQIPMQNTMAGAVQAAALNRQDAEIEHIRAQTENQKAGTRIKSAQAVWEEIKGQFADEQLRDMYDWGANDISAPFKKVINKIVANHAATSKEARKIYDAVTEKIKLHFKNAKKVQKSKLESGHKYGRTIKRGK